MNYYNENEPYAAAWLRNLIALDMLPEGDVDERSIADVRAGDLGGYAQCHFFAGIGGWSYALRLAGWPDDRPVWTGSCPCQPFSSAGARKGFADERHPWPIWFGLIRECRPAIVFGEQVARAIGQGWLDAVSSDLEGEDYAIGAAVLPACAVDAPHRRDRLWFVADTDELDEGRWEQPGVGSAFARPVAHAYLNARQQWRLGDAREGSRGRDADRSGIGAPVVDPTGARLEGWHEPEAAWSAHPFAGGAGEPGPWPVEPALCRVAHGIPARAPKLRALGNAIVPQVAAQFIGAYMDCRA